MTFMKIVDIRFYQKINVSFGSRTCSVAFFPRRSALPGLLFCTNASGREGVVRCRGVCCVFCCEARLIFVRCIEGLPKINVYPWLLRFVHTLKGSILSERVFVQWLKS